MESNEDRIDARSEGRDHLLAMTREKTTVVIRTFPTNITKFAHYAPMETI